MKFLLWMVCLVYFSGFLMVVKPLGYTVVIIINLVLGQLRLIQRSCDWYVENNIFPWQATKAMAIYKTQVEAKQKEKADAIRRKQNA